MFSLTNVLFLLLMCRHMTHMYPPPPLTDVQALLAIGYNLDRQSIRSMRETFRALDVEGKGRIGAEDLKAAMIRHNMCC